MMSTISFREIVKLIHPDTNPNITEPGLKMVQVKENRGNERALYNLGVQWGVIQAPRASTASTASNTASTASVDTTDYEEFRRRNGIYQAGDLVWVTTKRSWVRVTRISGDKVFFQFNGKKSWAKKTNVTFA